MRTRRGDPSTEFGGGEGLLHVHRTADGVAGGLKGDHEGVALGLHLEAVVAADGFAHEAVVLAQQLHPAVVAEFDVERRRALDVAEEDGDGAVRRGARGEVRAFVGGGRLTGC